PVKQRVLPAPGPARTRTGPGGAETARHCWGKNDSPITAGVLMAGVLECERGQATRKFRGVRLPRMLGLSLYLARRGRAGQGRGQAGIFPAAGTAGITGTDRGCLPVVGRRPFRKFSRNFIFSLLSQAGEWIA